MLHRRGRLCDRDFIVSAIPFRAALAYSSVANGFTARCPEATMKVFLVDDSVYIRQRLNRMLATLPGVEMIGEATEAEGATRAIQQLGPDVVILDIHLIGQGTGIDVLQSIKQKEPAPRVIILTNYPYLQYQKKCFDAGADFFLDKSTQFDRLAPIIEQLRQSKERQENPGLDSPVRELAKFICGQPSNPISFKLHWRMY